MRHERSASASASASTSDSGSDSRARRFWLLALASAAAMISACKTAPRDSRAESPSNRNNKLDEPAANAVPRDSSARSPLPQPAAAGVTGPVTASRGSARSSSASTPRAYRQDGATHLYGLNANRIYKGKMPPLLYAVGVLNVEIDGTGRVTRIDWMRAPSHAPEVITEIERTIRSASPFPAPTRMGRVVYTDTWLWHVSGKFQLDTLTEGQS